LIPRTPTNSLGDAVFYSFATAALLLATDVAAQDTWSVDDAIAAAHASAPLDVLLGAQLVVASAELEAALVRPTPSLGIQHETLLGDRSTRDGETTVSLRHPFDVSSWRDDLRATLPYEQAALREDVRGQRVVLESQVNTAFFEVRHREERIAAIDQWMERLQTGVDAAVAREDAGDASEYDVRRVRRELQIAAAMRAAETSSLAESWAGLATLAPHLARPTLVGVLSPPAPIDAALDNLPALLRLDALAAARDAEAAAWGSPGLRDWELGAGYRLANRPGALAHGFTVELSIPLPTRNTDAARIDALHAQASAFRAERLVTETLASNASRAARVRVEQVLEALHRMPDSSEELELTRMAEVAYAAGEASLTELLDAYGSETELLLARTDLEWEARRASIEAQLRQGQRREE
jgi:cobalt-zinc-cadmium efflux system outer membrane protein